jgi:radical SAM superfamily enzyme YgiQ (UPF0313 family)
MREAWFTTVFCGIETPDPESLKSIAKDHNLMVPILEGVQTLNRYGMEVVSGIILGLDSDTPQSGEHLLEFVEQSQIPMLTINLLQALPRTPLWDRLEREQRLVEGEDRDSNVEFRLPYDLVIAMWRESMAEAYQPEALFARFEHQVRETYPNRLKPPPSRQRASFANIKRGVTMFGKILWQVGVMSDYRRVFWRFAWPRLRQGDIEAVISVGLVAHHLIMFARDAVGGRQNASNYSVRLREASVPAE